MINHLREYCNIWHLTVNLLKTKVIVFRNGGPLRNYEHWKFGEKVLDVVTYYKYLGILFSSRNSWLMAQKTLANQALKALFAVKSKLTQFGDVNLSVLLAHLSRRLIGELIVYPWSGVRHTSSVVVVLRPQCSNIFFSETAWPIKAKFYVEPPWVGGTKFCLWHLGHMTKMAATPYMVKTIQKSSSPEPPGRFSRNLVCSIGDSSPS